MVFWKKAALGAAGLLLAVLAAREIHALTHQQVSAAQVIAAHPVPALYSQSEMAPYAAQVDAQGARAAQLMQGWWRTSDTGRHDRKFVAWLKRELPAPPSASSRKAEAKQLEKLVSSRTASGKKTGQWLQTYGARDLWLYYGQRQAAHLPKAEQHTRHKELFTLLRMAKTAGKSLNNHLQQPAPFLIDPAVGLGQVKKPTAGTVCPCSYPAADDAVSAAGRTFLSYLYPGQTSQYKRMTDELGFAQVYLGNHLPSDVDAGSLLGDMVGEYFLVTRDHVQASHAAAALARQ